jgi:hypothetical protein
MAFRTGEVGPAMRKYVRSRLLVKSEPLHCEECTAPPMRPHLLHAINLTQVTRCYMHDARRLATGSQMTLLCMALSSCMPMTACHLPFSWPNMHESVWSVD